MVMEPTDCASCHHQEINAAECSKCHETQSRLFTGQSAIWGDTPDPESNLHYENPCRSCHGEEGPIVAANSNSCLECHDEDIDETYADWQDATRSGVDEINASLADISPSSLSAAKRAQYNTVRTAIDELIADKSWGVHNAQRVEEILEHAAELVEDMQ